MSTELSVSSSQGKTSQIHDTILEDGRRFGMAPNNADAALSRYNKHLYGDIDSSDADKFNAIFEDAVADFNSRQTRRDKMMGPDSSKPERQISYYEGIMNGTFARGKGDQKEHPVYEAVLQLGNKDDNEITDSDFDMDYWKELKMSGKEDEASTYALSHLNRSQDAERTKRILTKATQRIVEMNPEHLIVLRADLHADEPCGTPHVHIAYSFKATQAGT